ncbi:hypothetical protein FA13DRAFT_1784180 [Coprinellus micaceus]|uniref:Uncharacterized protein n=1 Tax=Coprinellus micaceus TaxID=71717 RepID=A0A4Y7TZK6_COPMI|nr:hypothetical protein FA13DRAFT_1784180 [Coprinellus micaceus]
MAPTTSPNLSTKRTYLAVPARKLVQPASRRQWPAMIFLRPAPEHRLAPSAARIPKPVGEVGRPGRGGYALRKALDWSDDRYKDVQLAVREIIRQKLDISKPFTEQNKETMEEIIAQFPDMKRYHKEWPASDFVKCALRNTARYRN